MKEVSFIVTNKKVLDNWEHPDQEQAEGLLLMMQKSPYSNDSAPQSDCCMTYSWQDTFICNPFKMYSFFTDQSKTARLVQY